MGAKTHAQIWPRLAAWALILVAALVLFLRYPGKPASYEAGPPGDFAVYLKAKERASRGESPYVKSEGSPYKYSPGALVLAKWLPDDHRQAWVAASSVFILLFALSLLALGPFSTWSSVAFLGLGLALSWKGILETMDYGQLELLIFSIAALSAVLCLRQPFLAGLLGGTLFWLKLPWVLLFFPMLVRIRFPALVGEERFPGYRKFRLSQFFSGYLMSWFLWGAALPVLIFGSDRTLEFSRQWVGLLSTQPRNLYTSDINQSLWSTLERWGTGWATPGLTLLLGGLGMALATSQLLRVLGSTRGSERQGIGVAISPLVWLTPWLILTQILNPLSWRWGSAFLVGVPLAAFTAWKLQKQGSGARFRLSTVLRIVLAGIALALWLLQLNPVVQALGFQHWTDLHPYGLVSLYWVALFLIML